MNLKDAGIYDIINIFKGKSTTAHTASQGGVINNKSRVVNIPAYQRPYRWQSENIEQLFDDYTENTAEYFIGSAVYVEKNKADGTLEFDVVDGQQRITTLYLLNYVRYLLLRRIAKIECSKALSCNAIPLCTELKECYVNLIGKKAQPFENIINKIKAVCNDELLAADPDARTKKIVDCFNSELGIVENLSTREETYKEKAEKNENFLSADQLCLKYSRDRYNCILRKALSAVEVVEEEGTNQLKMINLLEGPVDDFTQNYINALMIIFNRIWKMACESTKISKTSSSFDICDEAVQVANKIVENMSICIVLTESEEDANKLFEVLNDRSLTVEDLELIKNHFYKEYCTKSKDSDVIKDKNITKLDEIWTDEIFSESTEKKSRLISYLAAVYLTKDKDLAYKDDSKLKDIIDKKYTAKEYSSSTKNYDYDSILSDFNSYYAMRIIIDRAGLAFSKTKIKSIQAEQDNKSITYRALHLLNAMEYTSVLPALTSLILASYSSVNKMNDPNFKKIFEKYIDELLDDKTHSDTRFGKIHKCAHMLWLSTIKAKDFSIPRQIASRIIETCGRDLLPTSVDFSSTEVANLDKELTTWLDEWSYKSNRTFIVKILMFHLLSTTRDGKYDYKSSRVELEIDSLKYTLEAKDLQLDHLEAKEFNASNKKAYFLSSDKEKRDKIVNGYLGNFMILDADDNNAKNNVPLASALGYYSKMGKSWLIKDLEAMKSDTTYFTTGYVPKEAFFDYRSKQLKAYFKAFLSIDLGQDKFDVIF